jgi:hypothetical protein
VEASRKKIGGGDPQYNKGFDAGQWSGALSNSVHMRLFAKECPHCGRTKAYHWIPSSRYAPIAPVVFGGVLLALIFCESRKQQFRCELCGATFSTHTIVSRFFQLFWVLLLFLVVCWWLVIFCSL